MSAPAVRVLLVEDNPGDARLVEINLSEAAGGPYEIRHVDRLSGAFDAAADPFDVILLDLSLPDSQGIDTLIRTRSQLPQIPVVVLTGLTDAAAGVRALQEGAQDYIEKNELSGAMVGRAIRYALERQRLQAQLEALSLTDDLTGLYNRRGFFTVAEQQLRVAERYGRGVAMLYADLDGMKQINDLYGHSEGDRAIKEVGHLLFTTFRGSDVLARLGGDEFSVLAFDVTEEDVTVLRSRLSEAVHVRNIYRQTPYPISVSVGAVHYHRNRPLKLAELLARADEAMYVEKRSRAASSGGGES